MISSAIRQGWLACLLIGLAPISQATSVRLPPGFQDHAVFTGLNQPTAVRFAPNGQVFVAEKAGIIKLYDDITDSVPTIFADLRTNVFNNWDRGLLGLAVDPAYPAQPYIYVLYTYDAPPGGVAPVYNDLCDDNLTNGCPATARLSRLQASGSTMVGPEQVLIHDWCIQYPSHSIGDLVFGADGALYVTAGDGASFTYVDYGQLVNACLDPPLQGGALRSQDLETAGDPVSLHGALLRVNAATGAAVTNNPLFGGAVPDDDRILAYGLRNPYRFTFRPGTQEIWLGDVGSGTWEELNRISNVVDSLVENFGWPCFEGINPHAGYQGAGLPICAGLYTNLPRVTRPYFQYQHGVSLAPGNTNAGSSSITGVAFYPGGSYPTNYDQALFFADYSRQTIFTMAAGTNGLPATNAISLFAGEAPRAVDLQVGPQGNIYYVDHLEGSVRVFRYFDSNQPPIAVFSATPSSGQPPLPVILNATASFDPDTNDTISLAWDLDGDGQFDDSSIAILTNVIFQPGYHNIRLRVTDNHGAFSIQGILVVGGNSPPEATVLQPPSNILWKVGDALAFSGRGIDPEEGVLPPSAFTWSMVLHHCAVQDPQDCHEHVVQQYAGVTSGVFVAVDHEYPAHLEMRLTVTDSGSDWWDSQWGRRRRVTFNNFAHGEESNVVVLVRLDGSRVNYADTAPGGADLRFLSKDNVPLAYDIEEWNPAGVSIVWVKVPRIDGHSDNDYMWMYYRRSGAPAGQNPAAVWQPEYAAVWHLNGNLLDASGRKHDGLDFGSTAVTGRFAGARAFDGDDYIEVAFSNDLAFGVTSNFTLEASVRPAGLPVGWEGIVSRTSASTLTPWYGLWVAPDSLWSFGGFLTNTIYGGTISAGWQFLGGVQNGAINKRTLFQDGANIGSNSGKDGTGTDPLYIGATIATPGEHFRGIIDEVRVARVARSDNYMEMQQQILSDNLLSYGPEEVEDADGLSDLAVLPLYPQTVTVQFASSPTGVSLTVGSLAGIAPFSRTLILNSLNSLSAPQNVLQSGTGLIFQTWSDGGARVHTFTASATQSVFQAVYGIPRAAGDYSGDRRADPAVYTGVSGLWRISRSDSTTQSVGWGWSATVPVPGDYDGDGREDVAVYWPSGGNWYVQQSTLGLLIQQFGWSAAVPVPGDFDGDGRTDLALFWPQGGTWYLQRSTAGLLQQQFGWSAAVPVPGDYDGDGRTDLAVYWPGGGTWYILQSSLGLKVQQFGWAAAAPVPADYDGDGKTDPAVYWPGGGMWYLLQSASGIKTQQFGWSAAAPIPADYDGDGKADLAVYWPQGNTWYILQSSGGLLTKTFGDPQSRPAHNQYRLDRLWGLLP